MIDLFRQLKLEYRDYLILFKCGNFYISFDEDATILNNIFNYKIVEMKNNIKVGFPIKMIDNNLVDLKEKNIYYIVIDDKRIIKKNCHGKNKYYEYVSSVFNIVSLNNRLNKIIEKIKSIKDDNTRERILDKIEEILYI